jgi:lactate dehydrogenase-like 2-hydroxyacid dehydrogenase
MGGPLVHSDSEGKRSRHSYIQRSVLYELQCRNSPQEIEKTSSAILKMESTMTWSPSTDPILLQRYSNSSGRGMEGADRFQFTGPFDAELISLLPKSLKYICHNGAGYDNIDIPACSEKGAS